MSPEQNLRLLWKIDKMPSRSRLAKKNIFTLFIFIELIFLASCNSSILNPKVEAQSFSYHFTIGNCTTNEKVFSTLDQMCAGLRDDAFNNYCAQDQRYEKFQTDCPGKTW